MRLAMPRPSHQPASRRVALQGGGGEVGAHRRAGLGEGCHSPVGMAGCLVAGHLVQAPTRGERVPTSAVPTRAFRTPHVDDDVPDLAGEGGTSEDLPVQDDPASDSGTEGERQGVVVAARRADSRFGQGSQVGVVVYADRAIEPVDQKVPVGNVLADDVRAPHQDTVAGHQSGHAEADGLDLIIEMLLRQRQGGFGHVLRPAGPGNRGEAEQGAIFVHSTGGHLCAAQVNADRDPHRPTPP